MNTIFSDSLWMWKGCLAERMNIGPNKRVVGSGKYNCVLLGFFLYLARGSSYGSRPNASQAEWLCQRFRPSHRSIVPAAIERLCQELENKDRCTVGCGDDRRH